MEHFGAAQLADDDGASGAGSAERRKAVRKGITTTPAGITIKRGALWAGPIVALLMVLLLDIVPGSPVVTRTAAIATWMVIWWLTEAVPMAVTALLPVALFPLMKILSGAQVAGLYFNSVIFLFLGGFMVALAMERWNLHRRLAYYVVSSLGGSSGMLLLGFMLAAAFLSMWISNTATTMMMVPIALGAISSLEAGDKGASRLGPAILLGIAYASSIGGIATLVGTPPNLVFMRTYALTFPDAVPISFTTWFAFALPISIIMFALCWLLLKIWMGRGSDELTIAGTRKIAGRLEELGPMSPEERAVMWHFIVLALLWLTRGDLVVGGSHFQGWGSRLGLQDYVDDGTVAVLVAISLFLTPSKGSPSGRLMDWETAKKLPWHIILLFGGGFALAQGFVESGLSAWVGDQLSGFSSVPPVLIVLTITLILTFLTEVTSNTATAQVMLPILAAVAMEIGINPLMLMVPATISASCAFMMPIATPPNAIVYGTDRLSINQMAKVGLRLNLLGAVIITAAIFLWGGVLMSAG